MNFADRVVIGLFWLSWRWARAQWSLLASAVDRRSRYHPRVQRRLIKMEYQAWSRCCLRAARLAREKRRVL